MLSNSCKYGIRAVVYIASQGHKKGMVGIKQISQELGLPSPFLAKILQQLAKQKILNSAKGPNGGFSLVKDPRKISLLDIIKTIDGDDLMNGCVIHNDTCTNLDERRLTCTLHEDYSKIRTEIIGLFEDRTIYEMVKKAGDSQNVIF
jgi:Rrf2 family protein